MKNWRPWVEPSKSLLVIIQCNVFRLLPQPAHRSKSDWLEVVFERELNVARGDRRRSDRATGRRGDCGGRRTRGRWCVEAVGVGQVKELRTEGQNGLPRQGEVLEYRRIVLAIQIRVQCVRSYLPVVVLSCGDIPCWIKPLTQ